MNIIITCSPRHHISYLRLRYCNNKISREINKKALIMTNISFSFIWPNHLMHSYTTSQLSNHSYCSLHQLIVQLTPDFSHLTPSTPSTFLFRSVLILLGRGVRQTGRTFIRKAAINNGLEGRRRKMERNGWSGRGSKNRSTVSCTNIW